MSIRLDPALQSLVAKMARRSGRTVSDVVRQALLRFIEETGETAKGATRPYDRVAHLLGSVHGGPSDLSTRTGRRFSEKLRERRGRRG